MTEAHEYENLADKRYRMAGLVSAGTESALALRWEDDAVPMWVVEIEPRTKETEMTDKQVLDTIHDETLTSYKVEYRHTKLAKGLLMEKSWVVEYANIPDYPEAFDRAERLATMYRFVRVVRIEKTSRLTVAWASEEAL